MAKEVAQTAGEVLNLYKKRGETPLQTIERYIRKNPGYKKLKMTYAGRLDPMAEGVLVVLVGDRNKERETYTGLDKEYEFEFVPGIETDTHDLLGKITAARGESATEARVKKALSKYKGVFEQKYPAYSSKVVDGRQLFEYARAGELSKIELPKHEVTVSSIELVGKTECTKNEFARLIRDSVTSVKGDFRQEEILRMWEDYFILPGTPEKFTFYKAKVSCGSGFYVRQLVSDLGKDLGTGGVTVSILRTRVGNFGIDEAERI